MFKKFSLFLVLSFLFIAISSSVFAADPTFNNYGLNNQSLGLSSVFGNSDIPTVIAKVIQVIMGLSATFMLGIIIYAGFIYLMSKGDSAKTKKAWDLIRTSSIGIIIIVTAYSLSQFIINNIKFIAS